MAKGTCRHGEFNLRKGCPQCVAERTGIKKVIERHESTTAIALRPGEDIEAREFYSEGKRLLGFAHCRVIATLEEAKDATNDLSIISKVKKAMEAKRKGYLAPLKAQSDAIRDTYNYLMSPILDAEIVNKEKLLNFSKEQERIRQEQEEINRKRLEAAEAEMKLKGELTESVNLIEVAPDAPKRVSTDMGTVGLTDHWKVEVIDFPLLPDEYKVADMVMLNSIAKKHHDQKQVAGVRFYNEPFISRRAK